MRQQERRHCCTPAMRSEPMTADWCRVTHDAGQSQHSDMHHTQATPSQPMLSETASTSVHVIMVHIKHAWAASGPDLVRFFVACGILMVVCKRRVGQCQHTQRWRGKHKQRVVVVAAAHLISCSIWPRSASYRCTAGFTPVTSTSDGCSRVVMQFCCSSTINTCTNKEGCVVWRDGEDFLSPGCGQNVSPPASDRWSLLTHALTSCQHHSIASAAGPSCLQDGTHLRWGKGLPTNKHTGVTH